MGLTELVSPQPVEFNTLALAAALVPIAPLGEEFGWRGYALPRLLTRFSAVRAGLILGLVWGVWHLPIFLVQPIYPEPVWASFACFVVVVVAYSIFINWVYTNTNGSLLSSIVFHQGIRMAGVIPLVPALPPYLLYAAVHAAAASVVAFLGFHDRNGQSGIEIASAT